MSPSTAAAAQQAAVQHVHFSDHCPYCDQEIPADQLEEIQGRIAVRVREQANVATALLREQYHRDRAHADAKAKADLEQVRAEAAAALEQQKQETAAREQAIREEEARQRDALLAERLAQAEAARKEQEQALSQRAAEAEHRAKAAAESSDALKLELEAVKHATSEALEQQRRAAAEREATARAAGRTEAEQAAEARVKTAETASRAAVAEASEKIAEAEVAKEKLAEDWRAKVLEATAAKQAAEEQVAALNASREAEIATRVQEARDAFEKARSEALLEKDKAHFDERQRWQKEVDDLKRKLDNQKSSELGEGAEIKLFDVLKEAFPDDHIRRVEKGTPGADVIQEVMLNGKLAGKIVFDSKNRGQWRFEYATKLRQDQIAEGADHAVLSTNKFPKDARELHLHEGVIIACPARVVVIAEILRSHILATHELRMSNDERSAKTEKLYAYVTSSQCRQLLESIEALVGRLEQIDADEVKAHKAVWIKRGAFLKDVLKANGDFRYALNSIIGTAGAPE